MEPLTGNGSILLNHLWLDQIIIIKAVAATFLNFYLGIKIFAKSSQHAVYNIINRATVFPHFFSSINTKRKARILFYLFSGTLSVTYSLTIRRSKKNKVFARTSTMYVCRVHTHSYIIYLFWPVHAVNVEGRKHAPN